MTVSRNCRVTSHYFVLLLKQTTEVKTLPIAMSHNFTTVALPYLRRSITAETRVRARIIPFGIRDAKKIDTLQGFLLVLSIPLSVPLCKCYILTL
jgi:hypothetical protein